MESTECKNCAEIKKDLNRLENMVSDTREDIKIFRDAMQEYMRKLTDSMMQVTKLEMNILQHADTMKDGFRRLEDVERRAAKVEAELSAVINKGRGVWLAISILFGGSLGVGSYLTTLIDRAANSLIEMRERISKIEYVQQLEEKDHELFRDGLRKKGSDESANPRPESMSILRSRGDDGKVIPIPPPPPQPQDDSKECNMAGCN